MGQTKQVPIHIRSVPYEVKEVKGSMITAVRPGHTIVRDASRFKQNKAHRHNHENTN
jgi:hypothetical protein